MHEIKVHRIVDSTRQDQNLAGNLVDDFICAGFPSSKPESSEPLETNKLDLPKIAQEIANKTRQEALRLGAKNGDTLQLKIEFDADNIVRRICTQTEQKLPISAVEDLVATFRLDKITLQWKEHGLATGSQDREDEIVFHELQDYLDQIKQVLCYEIANCLPEYKIVVVIKSFQKGDGFEERVSKLNDNQVLKYVHEDAKETCLPALERLMQLPERCPYLFYGINYFATIPTTNSLVLIEDLLEIESLTDFLDKKTTRMPGEKALRVFSDCLQAAKFLVDHGLRLSDCCEDNFFYDRVTDRGMLKDYDGLRLEGATNIYIRRVGNYPTDRENPLAPISIADMVFEFGRSLEFILGIYGLFNSRPDLVSLSREMTDIDPALRPSFEAILEKLTQAT